MNLRIVYCIYYAPICRAIGIEKASFARIVGESYVAYMESYPQPMAS